MAKRLRECGFLAWNLASGLNTNLTDPSDRKNQDDSSI